MVRATAVICVWVPGFLWGLLAWPAAIRAAGADGEEYRACGAVALYCSAKLLGVPVQSAALRRLTAKYNGDPTLSFADLARAARRLSLEPVAVRLENVRALVQAPMPAIAHMRYPSYGLRDPHFVTILRCTPKGVWLLDGSTPRSEVNGIVRKCCPP